MWIHTVRKSTIDMSLKMSFFYIFLTQMVTAELIKPNMRFTSSFQTASQEINRVKEGSTLMLEVERSRGTFREVHVMWKMTHPPGAQIDKPNQQLSPMNGTLTFKPVSICGMVYVTVLCCVVFSALCYVVLCCVELN